MNKKIKVVINSVVTIILIVAGLFLSRKTIMFIDPIDNNTHTTLPRWVWEKEDEGYPILVHSTDEGAKQDCIVTGVKKIKQGYGVFRKAEYELQFESPKYTISYHIGKNVKKVDGIFSAKKPFALEVGGKGENGKTIVGWYLKDCYEAGHEDCAVLTELPECWSTNIELVPAYDNAVVENEKIEQVE